MRTAHYWILLLLASIMFSCKQRGKVNSVSAVHCAKQDILPVKYAKGFTVDYYNGFKIITVRDKSDTTIVLAQYALFAEGKPLPVEFRQAIHVATPVTKLVCISTNHIAQLSRLGLQDSIAAVANTALVYDRQIIKKIQSGSIVDIGTNELNYEKIVSINPAFVITAGNWDGGDKVNLKLSSLGIKSALNLDYMEQDPLARVEWIKYMAVFYDKEYEADSIFNEIEKNYLSLKQKVGSITHRPTVFTNMPFKEIWYMPCGENYMARLITDAGGDFLWNNEKATNGLNLNLDYEAVFSKANDADFWINTGFAKTLSEIKAADNKNAFFKAYNTASVYNNDKRQTSEGGFDFWESGVVNPDIILADLISIFHPDLLPEHQLYYYRKLK